MATGGVARSNVPIGNYDFVKIREYGKEASHILMDERHLFLDPVMVEPERSKMFRMWEEICRFRKYSYVVGRGVLRQEVFEKELFKKMSKLNRPREEVLANYSFGYPNNIYAFFREETKLGIGKIGEGMVSRDVGKEVEMSGMGVRLAENRILRKLRHPKYITQLRSLMNW